MDFTNTVRTYLFSYIYTTYKMNPTDAEIAEDDKTSDS